MERVTFGIMVLGPQIARRSDGFRASAVSASLKLLTQRHREAD